MRKNPKFCERLNMAMEVQRMSQTKLAAKAGISRTTIVCYCNGYTEPTVTGLMAICDALGVSPNVLLGYAR